MDGTSAVQSPNVEAYILPDGRFIFEHLEGAGDVRILVLTSNDGQHLSAGIDYGGYNVMEPSQWMQKDTTF